MQLTEDQGKVLHNINVINDLGYNILLALSKGDRNIKINIQDEGGHYRFIVTYDGYMMEEIVSNTIPSDMIEKKIARLLGGILTKGIRDKSSK